VRDLLAHRTGLPSTDAWAFLQDADAYTGTYRSELIGDVRIEHSGRKTTLKTKLVDFDMSHWHLDTFLVEHEPWEMHAFASFNIGPDGKIKSFDFFGLTFMPVDTEKKEKGS
jgi:hypothetical protein